MHETRPWKVHVEFAGRPGKPLVLPVALPTAEEALQLVKGAVRDILLASESPGGSEYTISVFPPGYRAGDESTVAETVTLVTMRRS